MLESSKGTDMEPTTGLHSQHWYIHSTEQVRLSDTTNLYSKILVVGMSASMLIGKWPSIAQVQNRVDVAF